MLVLPKEKRLSLFSEGLRWFPIVWRLVPKEGQEEDEATTTTATATTITTATAGASAGADATTSMR